jgi:SAM-dependent methyltransferase
MIGSHTVSVPSPSQSPAASEVLEMLKNGQVDAQPAADGYIDLLQERNVLDGHPGQRIFAGKLLPIVYERLWRPLISRLFLGFGGPNTARERAMVFEGIGVTKKDRVLDVGCGTGNYTRHLAEMAEDGLVVGFDASATMLAQASSGAKRANTVYVRGDACSLPFADGEFDVVSSVGVLHMMEDWDAALDEMVRMLAPGGRLAIATLCNKKGESGLRRVGGWVFGPGELPGGLRDRGAVEIRQQRFEWWQIVFAQKPSGVSDVG